MNYEYLFSLATRYFHIKVEHVMRSKVLENAMNGLF